MPHLLFGTDTVGQRNRCQLLFCDVEHGLHGLVVMRFPDDLIDDVIRRLRRVEGQIRGVQQMIQDGRNCADVVTQLSAINSAMDRVNYRLFAAGMRHCVVDPEADMTADELEKLFVKLG